MPRLLVISLSIIPSRFAGCEAVLRSLLAQSGPDTKVELYIPKRYRRFPDYDGSLPKVPKGVEICVVEEDLGPATKVLYAAEKYKAAATEILFCDDDRIYRPDWAQGFMEARLLHPKDAIVASGYELSNLGLLDDRSGQQPRARIARRALDWRRHLKRIVLALKYGRSEAVPKAQKPLFRKFSKPGYVAIGQGFGGFMVKPSFFDQSMWEIPPVMWSVDDVWLSGHLARRGIGIWAMSGGFRFETSALAEVDALLDAVIDGAGREEANIACVQYMQDTFGIWTRK